MQYEITYILKPELTTEEQTAVGDFISQRITKLKGKAREAMRTFSTKRGGTDENNLRKFAYPIRHYRQGYYYSMVFEVKESALAGLKKQLYQNEKILRFLVVKDFTPLKEIVESESISEPVPDTSKSAQVLKEVRDESLDETQKSSNQNSKEETRKSQIKAPTKDSVPTSQVAKEDIKEKVTQLDEELDKIFE